MAAPGNAGYGNHRQIRREGKIFYYINDGVYHTFSGVIYDHWIPNFHAFRSGKEEVSPWSGRLATVLIRYPYPNNLPGNLQIGDYLYTENIGATALPLLRQNSTALTVPK